MKYLYLIPARGGSKGIPGKNIKELQGKPLLHYSLELSRQFTDDENILLSTDSQEIIDCAAALDYFTSYRRPAEFATDSAGSYEFILDALKYQKNLGLEYNAVVLLQPTSPLRQSRHVSEMQEFYEEQACEMLVSVRRPLHNPFHVSFIEDKHKNLKRLVDSDLTCRQDFKDVYEYNGAIYIMSVEALGKGHYGQFTEVKKYLMPDINSVDIDTPLDWAFTEFLLQNNYDLGETRE